MVAKKKGKAKPSSVKFANKLNATELTAWLPNTRLCDVALYHTTHCQNENACAITCSRKLKLASDLSPLERNAVFKLWESNMKALFDNSSMKTTSSEKKAELFHPDSRFLLVQGPAEPPINGKPSGALLVAYLMFRFDYEEDLQLKQTEVLYLYELQISSAFQRQGIGQTLLLALEDILLASKLDRMMLTVLKENSNAISFYRKIGFTLADISPDETDDDCDYLILERRA